MSLKGAYRDLLTLSLIISIPIILIITFYLYFTSYDTNFLYIGLAVAMFLVLGAIASYRFTLDYVKTLFEKWK